MLVDTVGGAYPSMVNLKDGSVLIVYYEEGPGSSIRAKRFRATVGHRVAAGRVRCAVRSQLPLQNRGHSKSRALHDSGVAGARASASTAATAAGRSPSRWQTVANRA